MQSSATAPSLCTDVERALPADFLPQMLSTMTVQRAEVLLMARSNVEHGGHRTGLGPAEQPAASGVSRFG